MRTFLAADLDGAFLDAAAALGDALRGGALSNAGARWVRRDTMHVTVRFYGSSTEEQVDVLRASVLRVEPRSEPVVARAVRLTAFPRERQARVLVLDLDDGGFLASVAAAAESQAVALGFAAESRAYRPHLTLARFKAPADVRAACELPLSLPEARVTALTLYESKTLPSGPVYTPLARREL